VKEWQLGERLADEKGPLEEVEFRGAEVEREGGGWTEERSGLVVRTDERTGSEAGEKGKVELWGGMREGESEGHMCVSKEREGEGGVLESEGQKEKSD
jgi:hypothetical protein